LVAIVLAVHAGLLLVAHSLKSVEAAPVPHALTIQLAPPEAVKPPPSPPPPPPKHELPRVAPKQVVTTPVELPKTAPAADSAGPAVPVVAGPVAEPTPLPPPAPPAPEPVVEARGGIGYLDNPAPDYPRQAQLQGWEGRVVLLVRVATDGHPIKVDVKTSSGHQVLDEEAQRTVLRWRFAPAHRGDIPVEGNATVPIVFRR